VFLKKIPLFNKLILGLALSIVALVSLLMVSYDTSDKLYKSFSWVEHTYKVQAELETLILLLTKQESATRRFIITNDERSLWDINTTSKNINERLTILNSLINDNPLQVQRLFTLKMLFQKKLYYLYESINVKKSKDYRNGDLIHLVQEGNTYMSQIMLLKNTMENEEENLLKLRQNNAYLHMLHTNYSIYLAGILSVTCITLILFIIYKERAKQLKIEQELKALDLNKNKFFSIISHDLRGPANGIVKLTGFLKDENTSKEESAQIISLIESASIKLVNLLENLLTWARLQMTNNEFVPERQNMREVVQLAIESLKVNASLKEIHIENHLKEDPILADKNMVTTAFRNLISNSIKFTHPRGNISIYSERTDKHIHFFIKDNGIGMSEDIKNSLFKIGKNKSLNGTANEKGTGLGLILCKEFIEKNSGMISVESRINEGCNFKISFPMLHV
jgi:signal transduction histidine kinase